MKMVSKSQLKARLAGSVQLLVALLLALGPLTDFHGHEEAHACAEIENQNIHIDFANDQQPVRKEVSHSASPLDLGHSHDHLWCALCFFISVNHLRSGDLRVRPYRSTETDSLRDVAPHSARLATIFKRGPPTWWIAT